MYAIIKAGGNQYKITPGQLLEVDRLPNAENSVIKYPCLMVADGDKVMLARDAEKVTVTARIIKHLKGDKIEVSRFRHKVRHRRHIGFRPSLTQIKIESIGSKNEGEKSKPEVKPIKALKKVTRTKKAN